MMTAESADPFLAWALYYESLGWSVVPVRPGEKLPAVQWAEFQKRRATPDELRAWWGGKHTGHGIGLITGHVSGFFVIDCDDKEIEGKNGSEVLRTLESQHSPLPTTTEAITGSGGRHLLFRHPGPDIRIITRKDIGPGRGLDVRGDGGFIVAPPSIHACGKLYAWSVDAGPDQVLPAEAPDWLFSYIEDGGSETSSDNGQEYSRKTGPLGLDGDQVEDGREAYMRDTILACMCAFIAENGAAPTAQDLEEASSEQYWSHIDNTRPGRTKQEFRLKCQRTVERFHKGLIKRARTLEEAIAYHEELTRKQQRQQQPAPPPPPKPETTPDGLYQLLDIAGLRRLPPVDWLIDQWLPEGGFAALYAPPKSLKSFLALDLLLHIATGRQWRGRTTKQGAVLYVAGEGHRGAAKRVAAWLQHHQAGDDTPFYMTTHAIPMAEAGSVERLIATIRAKMAEIGRPIVLVCLDTVARSFGAGDENATKDMNAFIAGCDAVRHAVGAAVLGIHHTGKDKERGMRGSTALLGGVDTVIKVDRDEEHLTVEVEEQRDGEKSDPLFFKALKVELAGHVKPVSSLVLVDAEAPVEKPKKDFITIDMANKILRRVQEAWNDGDPYSDSTRAGPEKWVGGLMIRQFGLTKGQAVSVIGHWRDNGVYTMEERTKTRKGGMRVLKWPGSATDA